MSGWQRMTKQHWYASGGLRNTDLFRVQRNGRWHYYRGAAR